MKINLDDFNPFNWFFNHELLELNEPQIEQINTDYKQPRISRIKRIYLGLLFHISRTKMLAFLKLEKFDKIKINNSFNSWNSWLRIIPNYFLLNIGEILLLGYLAGEDGIGNGFLHH